MPSSDLTLSDLTLPDLALSVPALPRLAQPELPPSRLGAIWTAGRSSWLLILLLATLWIPPQVVLWGRIGGDSGIVWTVYREPKLAILQVFGWTFLAAWFWRHRGWLASREGRERVLGLLRHPFFLAFAAFVVYGATTLLWVQVPENLLYELAQYVFLFLFTLTLALWASREPRVDRWLFAGLAFALAPAVVVSALQLVGEIPALRPIDPGHGVRHGSLFGAKNPMALACLGSFFLVLARAVLPRAARGRAASFAAVVATVYVAGLGVLIVTLHSRTALFALLAACAVSWLGYWLIPGRRRVRLLVVAGLALALLAVPLALRPGAMARAISGVETLRHPASYLESDRGIYLRNTLRMVEGRPWGVGLGDWQTHYPLVRLGGQEAAFTELHQARRAHSDPVQILGETGWPGLSLWALLWVAALAVPVRDFLRFRRPESLCLAAQLFALLLAGATDYLVEQPWHKLQLFGVATLGMIVARRAPPEGETRELDESGLAAPLGATVAAIFVALVAGVAVSYFTQHLMRSQRSAELAARYRLALRAEQESAAAGDRRRLWTAVEATGHRVESLAGHSRTSYRDPLIRAHAALVLGERPRAVELCRQSLRLHPNHPNTYGLLAEIVAPVDPAAEKRYRRTQHRLLQGSIPPLSRYSTEIESHGFFVHDSGAFAPTSPPRFVSRDRIPGPGVG